MTDKTQPSPERLRSPAEPAMSDDDLEELAHSANQEALSFGLSPDVFARYFRTIRDRAARAQAPMVSSNYSLDADTHGIRALTCDAIMGAITLGAQNTNPAPEGHWLAPFWQMANAQQAAGEPVAASTQKNGDDAFWAWWEPYELSDHWFVELHKIARDAWRAAISHAAAAPTTMAEPAPGWDGKLHESLQRSLNALRMECPPALVNALEFEVRKSFEALSMSLAVSQRMYGAARDRLDAIDAAQPDPFATPAAPAEVEHQWGCRANAFGTCTCGAETKQAQAMADALDAKRWRALRDNSDPDDGPFVMDANGNDLGVGEKLDAAIDAAIAAQAQTKGDA